MTSQADEVVESTDLEPQADDANVNKDKIDTIKELQSCKNKNYEADPQLTKAITAAYHHYKDLPLYDRSEILPLPWTSSGRKQTLQTNNSAIIATKCFDITTIEELNALYYAVAVSVSKPHP
eukprot:7631050-Ditylum_brightwellii.AAC.1